MDIKHLKFYETKDIPTRAKYLECKCLDKANRFDLYCVGKVIHLQCILCNTTYQLIQKENVILKPKNKVFKKLQKKHR